MKAHSETHFENENIYKLLQFVHLNAGNLHLRNDSRILMKDSQNLSHFKNEGKSKKKLLKMKAHSETHFENENI